MAQPVSNKCGIAVEKSSQEDTVYENTMYICIYTYKYTHVYIYMHWILQSYTVLDKCTPENEHLEPSKTVAL